jgi:methyl coenzyme M reductase alpha subunit
MNRHKIGNIVEYVKSCGAFPYDMDDVIEGVQDILTEYGIYSILTDSEYYQLVEELLEMAERSEIAESARWASQHLVCGKDRQGTDFRIPNIRA